MAEIMTLAPENVWDYPRPPRLERVTVPLVVMIGGVEIARTIAGHRVLETSHPPTYYIPRKDVRMDYLTAAPGRSLCEFKGWAQYWSINVEGRLSDRAAWSYANPSSAYADIAEDLSFYASKVDACFVDDVEVDAQQGDFYGGWITANLTGPFKGGPGTNGW